MFYIFVIIYLICVICGENVICGEKNPIFALRKRKTNQWKDLAKGLHRH